MAIRLDICTIGDEIPFDLMASEPTGFEYHHATPVSSQAKSNFRNSYMLIHGKINHDTEYHDPKPFLPTWANTIWTPKNSMSEYYLDLTIEESKLDASIRKVRFTKAYVIEYKEFASDVEGVMQFSLLIGQKVDCQGEIEINGEPVQAQTHPIEQSEVNDPTHATQVQDLFPAPVAPSTIFPEHLASDSQSKNVPSGSGKGGKLTVDEFLDEAAKGCGYKNFAELEKAMAKDSKSRLKVKGKEWKYKLGEQTYGGPTDCSGFIYAIANKYGQDYNYLSTGEMYDEFKTDKLTKIPGAKTKSTKKGAAPKDYSDVPIGALLLRKGHVGIYIGNGREISAKTAINGENTNSASVNDKSGYMDNYTDYALLPFVDYSAN